MSSVLLVTDSSACLPPGLLDRPNVRVIPIAILVGDDEVADGSGVAPLVHRAIAAGRPVKSAPPSLIDYLQGIEDGDFQSAVVLTPAKEFTVMHRTALVAASAAHRPVEVVDTRTAAAGQGLVAEATLDALDAGASAAQAAQVARRTAQRTELVAVLPDLSAVERSGRVPATALPQPSRAGARPLFRFRDGAVLPLDRPAPLADGSSTLRAAWLASGGATAERTLFFHAHAEVAAAGLRAGLGVDGPVVEFSPAMAVHTGLGCAGVAWVRSG